MMMLKCLITSKRVGFLRGGNAINSNGLNDCWRPAVDFQTCIDDFCCDDDIDDDGDDIDDDDDLRGGR